MSTGSSFSSANNVLQKRWNQKTYQMHVAKKNGMRTKVDASSPKVYPHLQVNMKKLQAEEEKQAQIDHENRILLAKLTNIIRSGGQVDNWNFESEAQPKTLHAPFRNREQERIERENAALLKRLNSVKPQVNFDKMEDEYLMHNYFLAQKAQATKSYEVDLRGVQKTDKFVFYAKDRHADKEKTFVDGDIEETIEKPEEGEVRELTSSAKAGASKRLPTRQQLKRRSTKLPLIGPERKKAEEKKKKATVVKIATYNQKEEAAKLFKATKGMGNPEQILVQTLAKRQYQQRQDTMEKFEENYGLTLEEELKNNLNAEYDDIVEALLSTREDLDAVTLRRALKGEDSLVEPVIEILCTRSNAAIGCIKEAYNKKFGISLEDDITAEIKGKLKNLFLALAKGIRSEDADVDEDVALQDAEALRDAGDERWTPRSEKMSELLQSSSLLHFREVLLQYAELSDSSLAKELGKSLFGDFKDAMLCLVRCMNSNTQFLADRIHASLTGEADDMTLIRIIITRSELDLPYIRRSYKKKYKQTLMEAIEQKCQASFKTALVQMVQVHGTFQKQDQPKEEESGEPESQEADKPLKPSQQKPLKRPPPNTGAKVPASNPLVKSTGTLGSSNRPAPVGAKPKQPANSPGNSGKTRQAPGIRPGGGASAVAKKTATPPRKATPPKSSKPTKETPKVQPPAKKKVEEKPADDKEDKVEPSKTEGEKKKEEEEQKRDDEEKETIEQASTGEGKDDSEEKDGGEREEKSEVGSDAEMKSASGTDPTSENMSTESEEKGEMKSEESKEEEESKVEEYGKEIEMKPKEDENQEISS
ncbi:DNA ligase 1 [Strongylocentrotus purpuratus]|uniref:Annexin n=1 Tax=Strongylocentrotus purpuratus TaxID=7668 RepID=A0A7M7PSE6_STRPU|nr:DNA ligase 1 [Strongylocentrotus purpuratus]